MPSRRGTKRSDAFRVETVFYSLMGKETHRVFAIASIQ